MSTRARVGIVNADKTVTSIYTHHDGYISHHGPILLEHYDTEAEVRKLLALGDLSRLTGDLGDTHNFDTSYHTHPDWCCAYGRDRGSESKAHTGELIDFPGEEYNYLFRNNKWEVSQDCIDWRDLTLEVVTERLTS